MNFFLVFLFQTLVATLGPADQRKLFTWPLECADVPHVHLRGRPLQRVHRPDRVALHTRVLGQALHRRQHGVRHSGEHGETILQLRTRKDLNNTILFCR